MAPLPLTPEQITGVLNRVQTRLANSTAEYIAGSTPYTTSGDKGALAAVKEIAASDRAFAVRLVLLVEAMEEIPLTGAPEPFLADLNYLSYPFLLDALIEDTEVQVGLFEAAAAKLAGCGKAEALVAEIRDRKKSELENLRSIRKSDYASSEPESEAAAAS